MPDARRRYEVGALFTRHAGRLTVLAVILGVVLRLAFSFGYWVGKPLTHDEQEYLLLGRSLAEGRGFTYTGPDGAPLPGEHFGRAPIYPLLLSGVIALTPGPQPSRIAPDEPPVSPRTLAGVKIVQALIGGLTILLIARLAGHSGGKPAAVAAAGLAAVYPSLVWTPAYVFSETAYSALALGVAVWLAYEQRSGASRWRLAAVGILAGIAVLTRPAMIFFVALSLPWLWWKRGALAAGAFVLGATLAIAPWTARNQVVYGRFVLVASEGGITFWTGNNPLAIGEGDMAANPEIKRANLALRAQHPGLTPEELEPVYYREALSFIASRPVQWSWLMVRKAFYSIVPIGPSYRLHSPLYFWGSVLPYLAILPFAVLGLVDSVRRRRTPETLLLLGVASVLVGLVFFPQERFRIPVIDPMLVVLAACWLGGRAVHR
jgi:4-amino-4-deoxy-L-arabinose transferase-like glycosyltransferase